MWNDNFELEITSYEDALKVTCFDEDLFDNDVVGDITMKVGLFCEEQNTRKWLPLKYKDKKSAMILLETKFIPFRDMRNISPNSAAYK